MSPVAVLQLQRTVGNAATAGAVRRPDRERPVVLVEGGLRDDPGAAPPMPTDLGDFVTPSGDPMG